jgi:transposase
MVVAAWHMLATGETYRELGADYFARRDDPQRRARQLARQLEPLGYEVDIWPVA